jgi:tRNA(Ile)-lysidine synthetase-like protein
MPLNEALSAYQNQKWVIAVSGGPDSMALLDMAYKAKVECFVVSVNYHKRDSADRDERLVKDYCETREIDCTLVDAPEGSGNFQDFARVFRYEKFAEVAKTKHALGVMVAHHWMDDLETYLIQKQRRSQVTYYGLQERAVISKTLVVRPLLNFHKEELMDYCDRNKIAYGIDESNTSDDYLRNRLRKELMAYSSKELSELFEEKTKDNEDLALYQNKHLKHLNQTTVQVSDFNCLEYPVLFLQLWIRKHTDLKVLSEDHLKELFRQLSNSASLKVKLGSWRLIKQYGQISLLSEPSPYTIVLKKPEDLKTAFFEIKTESEEKHGFIVESSDYPITIRNAIKGEIYYLDGSAHKLSSWFISHKIPQSERESWPVVVNCRNEVIHIARIRIDRHLYTSISKLYMIK